MPPADPAKGQEADKADPGEVEKLKTEQQESQSGKYGSTETKPFKPPKTKEEKAKAKSWIEIELVDKDGKPVPGEKYRITLPDGSVAQGTLGSNGQARVDGIEDGQCQVCFPELDGAIWSRA